MYTPLTTPPGRSSAPKVAWKMIKCYGICDCYFQCEGKEYNHKSDVWALGCILYEMASRQKTFEGSNLPALVNKIMKVHVLYSQFQAPGLVHVEAITT